MAIDWAIFHEPDQFNDDLAWDIREWEIDDPWYWEFLY